MRKWPLWTGGCVVALVLILFWNPWSEPTRGPEVEVGEEKPAGHDHVLSRPPIPVDPDCANCPPRVATGEKRRPSFEMEAAIDATMDCWEFLRDAAANGTPNPDTSHLEDCFESPLAHADTVDQIQALIEAGAGLNLRGEFGHTPLYRQMHKAVTRPSEEKYALVLALLEAGADPWIEDERGVLPYDAARKATATSSMVKLQAEERLKQEMTSRGLTEEQIFAENPAVAKAVEEVRQAPDFAAKTLMALRDVMEQPTPDLMENMPQ